MQAVQADFLRPFPFKDLAGVLAANILHFVPDSGKGAVLGQFLSALMAGGQLIIVEYNAARGNRAVPYPCKASAWLELAEQVGFEAGRVAARTPSSFLGEMVAISALRPV